MSQLIQYVAPPALMKWLTQQARFQRLEDSTMQASHTIRTREALRRALKKGLESSLEKQQKPAIAGIKPAQDATK